MEMPYQQPLPPPPGLWLLISVLSQARWITFIVPTSPPLHVVGVWTDMSGKEVGAEARTSSFLDQVYRHTQHKMVGRGGGREMTR